MSDSLYNAAIVQLNDEACYSTRELDVIRIILDVFELFDYMIEEAWMFNQSVKLFNFFSWEIRTLFLTSNVTVRHIEW